MNGTPCQQCHVREATVELTQVVDGEVTVVRLCGRCAAEQGVAADAEGEQSPLGAFLAAMGGHGGAAMAAAAATPVECPGCGATLEDFRASGRVGCAVCWTTFERPLRDLVRRVHGATRHVGEIYRGTGGEAGASDALRERWRLKEALREAVAAEQFEQAAELRDRLRALGEP